MVVSTTQTRLVASVAGRLRIRQGSADPAQLARWQTEVASWPGVQSARLNRAALSLIVQYATAHCSQSEMESRIRALCLEGEAEPMSTQTPTVAPPRRRTSLRPHKAAWRRRANRGAKITAMVALPLSIALVYAGHKRLHAATGWLFVAALSVHLAIHRRNVFH